MKRQFLIGAMVLAAVGVAFAIGTKQSNNYGSYPDAVAVIYPTKGNSVKGTVRFEQNGNTVKVTAEISGLEPGSVHGFHIHQFGDMSASNGTSMGGHYNPMKTDHALPMKAMRHAGDLGNITADSNGNVKIERTFSGFSLFQVWDTSLRGTGGGGTGGQTTSHSVLGRGVVIHAKADDGGQPTGNAGSRIAYGVIGIAKTE